MYLVANYQTLSRKRKKKAYTESTPSRTSSVIRTLKLLKVITSLAFKITRTFQASVNILYSRYVSTKLIKMRIKYVILVKLLKPL